MGQRTVKETVFPEKISPFLRHNMERIRKISGEDSSEYRALSLQYVRAGAEDMPSAESNSKHYEADMGLLVDDHVLKGVERLYRRSMVIEPTLICASHCRYCLRANYDMFTLKEDELDEIAAYCGSETLKDDLREVLITGGDPLIIPKRLNYLVEAISRSAPNVKVMRIATRLITQDPERIDTNVYEIFRNHPHIRFELATQINHPVEFFPETVEKIKKINSLGVRIYSQNVLLRGVNDDITLLTELYDSMRYHGIEAHYLFHCVPIKGTRHLRTSVDRGIELAKMLVNSGRVSGRVKPMYAAMTDIGKITFYEGTILEKNSDNMLLLQSNYRSEERSKWNPDWEMPPTAEVDGNGYLRVWYLDGTREVCDGSEG